MDFNKIWEGKDKLSKLKFNEGDQDKFVKNILGKIISDIVFDFNVIEKSKKFFLFL